MSSPQEADVGITEYVSKLPGFNAILKHRFRDFQVREVDPQGHVARLTSLEPHPKAEDAGSGPGSGQKPPTEAAPAAPAGFDPSRLAAARPQLVASFAALAGPENGAVLDELLSRVMEMYGMKIATATEAAKGTATANGTSEVTDTAAAAAPEAGSSAPAANGGAGAGGGGVVGSAPVRVMSLLHPISSKEVRKAVHEFFRATPELPPMRTETMPEPRPTEQQQPQSQQGPLNGAPGACGGKRGRLEGGDEGPPAKWSRGRGRGGGGGWRGTEEPSPPPRAPQSSARIQVVFDPQDLRDRGSGAVGGFGGRGRGRDRDGGGGRGRGRGRGRGDGGEWEGGAHPFVRFVLYKENMDTQVALSLVSRLLGVTGRNCFGFAGTKDKRGVTCQFVTGFKVSPSRLAALNPRLRGIRLGSYTFGDEGLRLGCLAGNEFSLVLRDLRPVAPDTDEQPQQPQPQADPQAVPQEELIAQVSAACEAVGRNGFINYFGLQRFGTGGSPTHEVGRALLRGTYDLAVRLVLTGRPDERPEIAAARRLYFEKGDIKGALRGIPSFMLAERAVLSAMSRQGAWATAMMAVPRTLRMMYLHAWQSYVWNSAASHRIQTYGNDRAVEGDLVLPRRAAAGAAGAWEEGSLLLMDGGGGGGEDVADGVLAEDVITDSPQAAAAATTTAAGRLAMVKVVTAADVAAGRYSIFDVVLPLPGTEVLYPANETGEWIRKAAAEAGVDLSCPAAPASAAHRELSFSSLTGDYRYLLHRPTAFHFAFKRYTDPNDDALLPTDLERLEANSAGAGVRSGADEPSLQPPSGGCSETGGDPATSAATTALRGSVSGSGPYLALELRFQLPSSCYATMLLRDLMKTSTSKSFHAGLSAASAPAVPASNDPATAPPAPEGSDGDGAAAAGPVDATAMEEDGPPPFASPSVAQKSQAAADGGPSGSGGAGSGDGDGGLPADGGEEVGMEAAAK